MTLILLLLLGCGPKTYPSAPAGVRATLAPTTGDARPGGDVNPSARLPTPYTADQLREALPVGTQMRYRMEPIDQPAVEQRWTVTAADADTCTMSSTVHDPETGALLVDEGPQVSAWTELRDHASFPAMLTLRGSEDIDVPGGHFSTAVYSVMNPDGPMRRFWFAPELPGPPVQMAVLAPDGTVLMRMTLLERRPPE